MSAVPLDALRPFFDDERVTELLLNGPGPLWIERDGLLERTAVYIDTGSIERLIERVLGPLGRRVDHSSPWVDARLADGSRVNIVIPPIALDGPCVSIRRFRPGFRDLDRLARPAEAQVLRAAVRGRANIVVTGGAGAGKTTLLNALASAIDANERVITIEDAAELALAAPHVVRLEARPPNGEGFGAVTVRDLVRNALRMRPDRIVVGEVRGAEVLEMVQAMQTGHDGSFSTCHANSSRDALGRLESMMLTADASMPLSVVRAQLASSIDLIVHLVRQSDGGRVIGEIAEVLAPPSPGAPCSLSVLMRDGVEAGRARRVPRRTRAYGAERAS